MSDISNKLSFYNNSKNPVYPSKICSNILINKLYSTKLNVSNNMSFFGATAVQQQNTDYSTESIISLLQNYGLVEPNYWEQTQGPVYSSTESAPVEILRYFDMPKFLFISNDIKLRYFDMQKILCISNDKKVLVVGGPGYGGNNLFTEKGAFFIYLRNYKGFWELNQGPIIPSFASASASVGNYGAISNNGDIIAISGTGDNSKGAVWIYFRWRNKWYNDTKIVSTDLNSNIFGSSVSLNGEGNILAIGDPGVDALKGAVYIYNKGEYWSLVDTLSEMDALSFGSYSVFNNSGNYLFIGAPLSDSERGKTYVYKYETNWIKQTTLQGTGGTTYGQQGTSISLSGNPYDIHGNYDLENLNENTLAIGSPFSSNSNGLIWVFVFENDEWIQQGGPLSVSGNNNVPAAGCALTLDREGDMLLVGGQTDNPGIFFGKGAVWTFTRINNTWVQKGLKMVGKDSNGFAFQGASVFFSSLNYSSFVESGPFNDSFKGSFWEFSKKTSKKSSYSSQNRTIPQSAYYDVSTCILLKAYSLNVKNSASFFKSNIQIKRLPIELSISSVSKIFKTYGLAYSTFFNNQQAGPLIGYSISGNPMQGFSVSLSGDGNTLAVGGPNNDGNIGAVWLFYRIGEIWKQFYINNYLNPIIATDNVGASEQGFSISLSEDGNTLAIGGPSDDSNKGAVWIYTRNGDIWTQQGTKIVGITVSKLGSSVSLNGDGNTLAIGCPLNNNGIGATTVYVRVGSTWILEYKIIATGISGVFSSKNRQGTAVSLSKTGNTLAIGGPYDGSSDGVAWIFVRNEGIWTQQGNMIIGLIGSRLGSSISLSGDGNTLAIGGPTYENDIGATLVYIFKNSIWIQDSILIVSGSINKPNQGNSVSLNDDGTILIIGGSNDNFGAGASWVFKKTNNSWKQESKLLGSYNEANGNASQGSSVSISSDGITIAFGGKDFLSSIGATWIFSQNI